MSPWQRLIPSCEEMQQELIRIQEEVGITFIFVTHDQEEALTLSDKIVVMNDGFIQQIGTPEEIYESPANQFVARFIGEANMVDGVMLEDNLVMFEIRNSSAMQRASVQMKRLTLLSVSNVMLCPRKRVCSRARSSPIYSRVYIIR